MNPLGSFAGGAGGHGFSSLLYLRVRLDGSSSDVLPNNVLSEEQK